MSRQLVPDTLAEDSSSRDCPRCEHVKAHGWIGLLAATRVTGSHCKICHRDWVSLAQAHCLVCHEQFATDGTARRHWTKEGHVHPSHLSRLVAHDERWGAVWRAVSTSRRPSSLVRRKCGGVQSDS
jgi:hypothetical protein